MTETDNDLSRDFILYYLIFVADDRMLIASKKNENSTIELLIVKCWKWVVSPIGVGLFLSYLFSKYIVLQVSVLLNLKGVIFTFQKRLIVFLLL